MHELYGSWKLSGTFFQTRCICRLVANFLNYIITKYYIKSIKNRSKFDGVITKIKRELFLRYSLYGYNIYLVSILYWPNALYNECWLFLFQFRGAVLFLAAFFSILLFDHDLQQQQHAHADYILFTCSICLYTLCPKKVTT